MSEGSEPAESLPSTGGDAPLGPIFSALDVIAPGRPEVVDSFASLVLRRLPPGTRQRLAAQPEIAAARLASAFDLMNGRRPGELAVRVHPLEVGEVVAEINVEDSPFLLTTALEELARHGLEPAEPLHPVIGVERDQDGRVRAVTPARTSATRESLLQLDLGRGLDEEACRRLEDDLRAVMGDAQAATRDFDAMRERVAALAERVRETAGDRYPPDEVEETAQFLEWLLDDNFILLGYREYAVTDVGGEPHVVVRDRTGLGILSDPSSSTYARPVPLRSIEPDLRARVVEGDLLVVSRTNRPATVHRRQRMIYVGVKRVDEAGRVAGEDRLIGLFAQKAYTEPSATMPVLRRKFQHVLDAEDVVERSHDERALRTLFEAFPKHELFSASQDDLRETLVALMDAERRQNVRVLTRADPRGANLSVLVSLPRARFSAAVRERVQRHLTTRFEPESIDYHLSMSEREHALMHFQVYAPAGAGDDLSAREVEQEIIALTRTWEDRLHDRLTALRGEVAAAALMRRWRGRFPAGYQAVIEPDAAVRDVEEIEALLEGQSPVRMALVALGDAAVPLRFRLYKLGPGVELSAFVPILESLGFRVVEEIPHVIAAADEGADPVQVHDFGVRLAVRAAIDPTADEERVTEAAMALWAGEAEVDSLNQLVLVAGLTWRQVVVLRAYRRYRLQVGTSFTEAYQNDALVAHPEVARALIEFFHARFDPSDGDAYERLSSAREAMHEALDAVERLDQDRILRGFYGLIEATVRTNAYVERRADRGSPALSLKIDSSRAPDLPPPSPYAEIFVYSPRMEGVHLRGGQIARGGIRWSDRQEDVRAEVLGLMKAQMTKNAVIVPTGAKGGFVIKRPPEDRSALAGLVRAQYIAYLKALLDITGNVVEGEVIGPPRVRRLDGDDPYLVVAPDRGTATFSDLANEISAAYGFWLGDAFASGGSTGFDHKAMGITARGAWVAVQRHFRELDIDVQAESVAVAGIGDMSGDVFGNAMLQSRAIRLVAAFDHRHIFIDPDPDPDAAFGERLRLFEAEASSWDDYDRGKLSAGGGVWSRQSKAVPLSSEARALLRVDAESLTPPELIQAILRAPVDLLFAGGIGTFVKGSTERTIDVGDRANEAIRIDADELGARVVGEGANLALTQAARLQYARRGGRCNTDAIDNCAGVNTSDREVNLKILLRVAEERGELTSTDERAQFLVDAEADVAEAVLRDSYLQTWLLSQELLVSADDPAAYEQLMTDLERDKRDGKETSKMVAGRLNRAAEGLPTTAEMQERGRAGAGLLRPELAVLVGYSKVDLRTRLLASPLPDDPYLARELRGYFPRAVVERFGSLVQHHRLKRELIATAVANTIVNRMGVTYVSRVAHEFGCPAWQVAAAHWIAREVTDADRRWRDIEALDGLVEARLQLRLKGDVDHVVNACTRAYLRQGITDIGAAVETDGPAFAELERVASDAGPDARRRAREGRVRSYTDVGIDDALAERLVDFGGLVIAPDVALVSREAGHPVQLVADVFSHLNDALPLTELFSHLVAADAGEAWRRWQREGLLDELRETRRLAALQSLREADGGPAHVTIERFLAAREEGRERVQTLLDRLRLESDVSLDALAVLVRAVRQLVAAQT